MATAGKPSRTLPWRAAPDGVRVAIRVTPKSSRAKIGGVTDLAAGGVAIKVHVNAPPEGGKANAAVLHLLAKTWRIPKTALSVTTGAAGRTKTVHIAGTPEILLADLAAWLDNADAAGQKPGMNDPTREPNR